MAQRFLIAPMNEGLRTDMPPWLIPENAFTRLENAYIFRGKVTKRHGSILMGSGASSTATAPLLSRLRASLGAYAPGAVATPIPVAVGQQFSVGDTILTVINAGIGQALLTTGTITATVTGASQVTFVGAGAGTLFFYPGLPVMGICNYEVGSINNQPTIAFDTRFAYQFVTTAWTRIGTAVWVGDNRDYFQTTNWQGLDDFLTLLFATNFNAGVNVAPNAATDDPIRFWNGAAWTDFKAVNTVPGAGSSGVILADGSYITTARIIVPFHGRLVFLNVIETQAPSGANINRQFQFRARYSWFGNPLSPRAFLEPNVTFMGNIWGGGGFIDAPTKEEITGAEFIKDRLIVYFERSTWELVYTGNQVRPFVWQQLNTELGGLTSHAVIPFDKAILTVGDVGVHACNGSNVQRIDEKIPQEIFTIDKRQNNAVRVAGIRDYVSELAIWAYPSSNNSTVNNQDFPDKLLIYNYVNGTWARWDDSFTAFGYFYQKTDTVWQSIFSTWIEYDATWDAAVEYQQNRNVVAGNQEGYVVILIQDFDVNAQSLTVTNVTIAGNTATFTVIDHNVNPDDFIDILDLNGVTGFVTGIYQVNTIPTANTFTVIVEGWGGAYTGGGTLFRVSRIDILSKQWNPFINTGRSLYINYIDFCVHRTPDGQITVDYFSSASNLDLIAEAAASGALLGTNVLETRPYATIPFEQTQERLWHRVYFQTDGQFIQIRIYLNDEQMADANSSLTDFTLEALLLAAEPSSYALDF